MAERITPSILVHEGHSAGLPVVLGCPFPADCIDDEEGGVISFEDGTQVAVQCAPLTGKTLDGIRWVELSFLAPAKGKAHVTLGARPEDNGKPFLARPSDAGVELSNGLLRVCLNKRPDTPPLTVHTSNGKGGEPWTEFGTLVPEIVTDKGMVHRDSPDKVREVKILRNGPLRGQVELHGQLASLAGRPSLAYRLTVELWVGLPAIRVDWMLMHLVPDEASLEIHRATLLGEWNVGRKTVRRFLQEGYGPYYRPREVCNPGPVSLVSDFSCGPVHVTDPAMLLDDSEYSHYLGAPIVATDDWLGLQGDSAAVYATVVDFAASRPNQLESACSSLHYHFIPCGHVTNWPQGRRREQTILLSVVSGKADSDGVAEGKYLRTAAGPRLHREAVEQMHAVHSAGRAQPTAETLEALKCFDMQTVLRRSPGRNVLIGALLNQLCLIETQGDKWNLGDTRDAGYTRGYATTPNLFQRLPGAPEMPVRFNAGGRLYPWSAGEFVEPVWTNNEYDIIHALASEIMRTGKQEHFQMFRWTARHNIEVDFVAYSDDRWHHRATPFHAHGHNRKGAISSHFWTQGLLQYYVMTGDRDALEVALALGDKIVEIDSFPEARAWDFDRELGWAMLSLVCLVEAGFDQYRDECDKVADFLQVFDRAAFTGAVKLSLGRAGRSLERQMIDNAFGYASMVEAMDRYQKVSGRQDTAEWLETLLPQLQEETWNAVNDGEVPSLYQMVPHIMAIGYERTHKAEFIRTGMIFLDYFFNIGGMSQMVAMNNPSIGSGETKPCAMLYRALFRFLGHADRLGLLERFELRSILEGDRD